MADLQRNETYGSQSGSMPGLSSLGNRMASMGIPTTTPRFAPNIGALSNLNNFFATNPPIPEATQVGQPQLKPYQLPEWAMGYSNFEAESVPGGSFTWPQPNLDQTFIKSLPQSIGIQGEYMVDKSQPGQIVKSGRGLTQWEKSLMLGGRPSNLYEVDHMIPLWAGGADTPANYQVLSKAEHAKKTKIQAVAYSLMTAKDPKDRIPASLAKHYALRWQDLDGTDIPEPQKGVIPTDVAKSIRSKWDFQQAQPVDTFSWSDPIGSWKRFTAAIPDATQALARGNAGVLKSIGLGKVDEALHQLTPGYQRPLDAFGPAGEFVKGGISGLSGGWIPYVPSEQAGSLSKGAGYLGVLGGFITPGAMASKAVSRGLAAKRAEAGLTAGARELALGGTPNYLGMATEIPKNLVRAKAGDLALTSLLEGIVVPAGIFAGLGQLSPEGAMGQLLGQEGASAVDRFLLDLGYGLGAPMVGLGLRSFGGAARQAAGAIRGTEAAQGKSVLGQAAKPFTEVRDSMADWSTDALGTGVAALAIGAMADDDPKEMLLNAALMATLQGYGMRAAGKRNVELLQQYKTAENTALKRMAYNNLSTWLPETFNPLKESDNVTPGLISRDQAITYRGQAMDKLDDLNKTGVLSPEEYAKERSGIFAATKTLEYDNIPENMKRSEYIRELTSVAEQTKRLQGRNPFTPKSVYDAFDQLESQKLWTDSLKGYDPKGRFDSATGDTPVGSFRLSGMASGQSPYVEQTREYLKAAKKGNASPTVIGVSRPELAPMWKAINNRITALEIAEKRYKPFDHPENAIQWYGAYKNEAGEKVIVPLGFHPRESHIRHVDDGGLKYSFNTATSKHIKGANQGKNDPTDKLWMDPASNKDTFANAMRKNNTDVLIGNLVPEESGDAARFSKEPYIKISINPENWARTKMINSFRGDGADGKSMQELVSEVNAGVTGKQQQAVVSQIRARTVDPASAILTSEAATPLLVEKPAETAALQDILARGVDSLSQPDAATMAAKLDEHFGIEFSPEVAQRVHAMSDQVTVKQFLTMVNRRGNETTQAIFDASLKDFLESNLFQRGWKFGRAFPEMRVLGGIKKEAPMMAPDDVTAVSPLTQTREMPVMADEAPVQESIVTPTEEAPVPIAQPEAVPTPAAAAEVAPMTPDQKFEILKRGDTVKLPGWYGDKTFKVLNKSTKSNGVLVAADDGQEFWINKKGGNMNESLKDTEIVAAAQQQPQLPLVDKVMRAAQELGVETPAPEVPGNVARYAPQEPQVKPPTRQQFINKLIDDSVEEGAVRLEGIQQGDNYIQMLRSAVDKVRPQFGSGAAPGGGKLSQAERQLVETEVKNRLRARAEEIYNAAITPENEAAFTADLQPGDPIYGEVEQLIKARNAVALGNYNQMRELKTRLGDERFAEVEYALDRNKAGKTQGGIDEESNLITLRNEEGKVDWNDVNVAQKHAAKEVIDEFIDLPKNDPEGSYMRTFSDMVERVFNETLGTGWKNNQIVRRVLASLKDRDASGRNYTFWDNLLSSSDGEATQPLQFLKSLGIGHQKRAREIQEHRSMELEEARLKATEAPSGTPVDEASMDEISDLRIETPTQRGDQNIPAPAAIDRVLAGLNVAMYDGNTPTAQQALADATRFVFEFGKAYKTAWNSSLSKARERAARSQREAPNEPVFAEDVDGGMLGPVGKPKWVKAPAWKFGVDDANKLVSAIINELSEKGVQIGEAKAPKKLKKDAGRAAMQEKEMKASAISVIKQELVPKFQDMAASGVLPKIKEFKNLEKVDLAKLKKLGSVLYARQTGGNPMSDQEHAFLESFQKYQQLAQYVTEGRRLKDVAISDLRKKLLERDGSGGPGGEVNDGAGGPGLLGAGPLSSSTPDFSKFQSIAPQSMYKSVDQIQLNKPSLASQAYTGIKNAIKGVLPNFNQKPNPAMEAISVPGPMTKVPGISQMATPYIPPHLNEIAQAAANAAGKSDVTFKNLRNMTYGPTFGLGPTEQGSGRVAGTYNPLSKIVNIDIDARRKGMPSSKEEAALMQDPDQHTSNVITHEMLHKYWHEDTPEAFRNQFKKKAGTDYRAGRDLFAALANDQIQWDALSPKQKEQVTLAHIFMQRVPGSTGHLPIMDDPFIGNKTGITDNEATELMSYMSEVGIQNIEERLPSYAGFYEKFFNDPPATPISVYPNLTKRSQLKQLQKTPRTE